MIPWHKHRQCVTHYNTLLFWHALPHWYTVWTGHGCQTWTVLSLRCCLFASRFSFFDVSNCWSRFTRWPEHIWSNFVVIQSSCVLSYCLIVAVVGMPFSFVTASISWEEGADLVMWLVKIRRCPAHLSYNSLAANTTFIIMIKTWLDHSSNIKVSRDVLWLTLMETYRKLV